ncbi:MAG: hypothetical protein ACFE85_12950 [Candidatus Hodarchaeota archaeon]
MNEKEKEKNFEEQHPEILNVEEKEIPEQKPPNNRIIYHNLGKKRKKKR